MCVTDFTGGSVVLSPPANAGDTGFALWSGKILHAVEQLSPRAATTEALEPRAYAAAAKSLQSCPTLRDPIDGSPPGSPAPWILQARTLEWVAVSFSNAWKWKVKVKSLSHVRLLTTPWTCNLLPLDFPGKSTGVGCHCLLQEPILCNKRTHHNEKPSNHN